MKIITYYRVSTKRQGASGLGLEAQQHDVEAFAKSNEGTIIATYQEIESGTHSDRPQLMKAIAHCKRSKATLVVAKLDRLSRNVAFLSALMETRVDFVCCDYPSANKLTIHVLVAVAEDEADRISKRVKDALAAAKRRGVKLGSARPGHWDGIEHKRGWKKAIIRAAVVNRQSAMDAYSDLFALVKEWREIGRTLQAIATELNGMGHTTRQGKAWNPMQVSRVLQRVA